MADLATLGFEIRSEGLREGSKELDKLTAAAKRAEDAAMGLAGSASNAAKRVQEGVASAAARAQAAVVGGFSRMQGAAARAASALSGSFEAAAKIVSRTVAGMVAAVGVGLAVAIRKTQPIQGEIATLQDYLGSAWDAFATRAQSALQGVVRWTLETAAKIAQHFDLGFTQISTIWNRLPATIGDVVRRTANSVVSTIERMVNAAIGSINAVISLANKMPGINISLMGQVDLGRVGNPFSGAADAMASELQANADRILSRDYFAEWSAAANARAWAAGTTVTKARGGRESLNEYERATRSANRYIEAMKIEAETVGMSTRAAEAYRLQRELTNAAVEAGIAVTPRLQAEILAMADAYGRAAETADLAVKAQRHLDEIRGTFQSAFTDIAQEIRRGESALQSLGSALDRIADKLIEMAANNVFENAFGRSGTLNALLGSMASGTQRGLLGGFLIPGILHDGGIAGDPGLPSRLVPASAFAHARRYHNGGVAGLGPNEVPAILERGERVIPRNQVLSGGKEGVTVNQYIEINNAAPETRSWIMAQLDRTKREAISEAVAAVAKTRSLTPRYGQGVF